jgi:transposase
MIDYTTYHRIHELSARDKLLVPQIAAELSLDERTVRFWLDQESYRTRLGVKRESKLDGFKKDIARWLEQYPLSATQVLRRLRENGYAGGYSILKEYIRQIRPARVQTHLTLGFAPGECAQVDWGNAGSLTVGNTRRRLSFFVMVLCYSRRLYVEFTLSETMEQFLACHQNAFRFFGGVPGKVMLDNLKTAVLSHPYGQRAAYHPRYEDFAKHYGFEPRACGVRKPNEKGRVENAVGYVKKSFLAGLELHSLSAVQAAADRWRDTVANPRLHATTRQTPDDRFKEETLRPLPASGPYDVGVPRETMANCQFRVVFDTNRYSVPAKYAGNRVTLRVYPDRLAIYHNTVLIASPLRSYERYRDVLDPEHERELVQQRRGARDQAMWQRYLHLGAKAEAFFLQMQERRPNARMHMRKIVGLSEIYGVDAVRLAMDDAFELQVFSSEYVANILEQRQRFRSQEPGVLHVPRAGDMLELDLPPADLSVYGGGAL